MKLNFGKLRGNLKSWLLYFFQKDTEIIDAYNKLLRFSALQIFLSILHIAFIIGHGFHSDWGDFYYYGGLIGFAKGIFLLSIINGKVIKNYQDCCFKKQYKYKGEKLLLVERILSFSTFPFCVFMKPMFFWKNRKSREEAKN